MEPSKEHALKRRPWRLTSSSNPYSGPQNPCPSASPSSQGLKTPTVRTLAPSLGPHTPPHGPPYPIPRTPHHLQDPNPTPGPQPHLQDPNPSPGPVVEPPLALAPNSSAGTDFPSEKSFNKDGEGKHLPSYKRTCFARQRADRERRQTEEATQSQSLHHHVLDPGDTGGLMGVSHLP
ncbi:uncharacterized protein LOC134766117 [Penaeus indicus]|uniref:uncharacterized protein LOC134766117 n=1 Tax=Penaeus indicus TaxID=29960 RepID=UPI00300D147B